MTRRLAQCACGTPLRESREGSIPSGAPTATQSACGAQRPTKRALLVTGTCVEWLGRQPMFCVCGAGIGTLPVARERGG